jgi:hypothetical protein
MGKFYQVMCFTLLLVTSGVSEAGSSEFQILGWIENAYLPDPGIEMKAKLDTGAETSSLDSRIVKKFRRDGTRWVRFAVTDRDSGEEFVLVRERIRTIGVVQHDGTTQTRPVVMLNFCVAGVFLETEVSLIDRSEFNYPLLVGRTALANFALVDSSETFLGQSTCEELVPQEKGQ